MVGDFKLADVRNLIEKHKKHTASPVADYVLRNWTIVLPQFVKIFPRDYRRVLEEAKGIVKQEGQFTKKS